MLLLSAKNPPSREIWVGYARIASSFAWPYALPSMAVVTSSSSIPKGRSSGSIAANPVVSPAARRACTPARSMALGKAVQ